MKRVWLVACLVIYLLLQSLPAIAQRQNDLKNHPDCQYCGMNRKYFAHSRMLVGHQDGTSVGVCSIFCAAKDYLRSVDDEPEYIQVGDYNSKKLIDAPKAYWIIGGRKSGVMTNRAKWAFEHKKDALAFIKKYGGELIDFNAAMKASYEDMYEDMRVLKQLKLEHSRRKHADSHGILRN